MTQQELNATTCNCTHRHDQHSYNVATGKAACTKCGCEHCVHPAEPTEYIISGFRIPVVDGQHYA